jgi:hypothetical protein
MRHARSIFLISAWLTATWTCSVSPADAAGTYHPQHHAALPATLTHPVNWALYTARVPQPKPVHERRPRWRVQFDRKQSAWPTFAYSNARNAWNPHETALTTANVNPSSFGMLYSLPVDGEVYAQPLYVPHVNVPHLGFHDLLIVATEGDSIYAFDAESGQRLWKKTFVNPPSVTTFDPSVCQCSNIAFQQGITGTPVVDLRTLVMYFVTKTVESSGSTSTTHYRLRAVGVRTGSEVVPNADITASVIASDGSTVVLDQVWSIQRPSLALVNRVVYVGFGSGADYHPLNTSGWLIAFDKTTLSKISQFCVATGDSQLQQIWFDGQVQTRLGSIWMAGAAPVVDAQGNLYVQTGNGAWDGQLDWAMSVLKVAPDLSHVVDYFTPSTWLSDSNADLDLGSAGVTLLPRLSGRFPNVLIGGGKTGISFLLNAHNLGKFNASGDRILSETTTNDGLWGTTAAYIGSDGNTRLIVPGGGPMTLWQLQTSGTPHLGFASQTLDHFSDYDDAGSEPVISSNGTTPGTAIVWAYSRIGSGGPANLTLRAYDASNLANKLVELPFTNWQGGGELLAPSVANGMVFAGGEGVVNVYGQL